MKNGLSIPHRQLQGIRREFAPLIAETEHELAGLAAATHKALASGIDMRRKNVLFGDRFSGIARPNQEGVMLSNGAQLNHMQLAVQSSLAHEWPRTARTLRVWTPYPERSHLGSTIGVSTDGMAFEYAPLCTINPIGERKDAFAKHMPSEIAARRHYARTYAGAAAVGSYIVEGLQSGFGLDVSADGLDQLQERWLSPNVSDATSVRHDLDWVLPKPPEPAPTQTRPRLYILR